MAKDCNAAYLTIMSILTSKCDITVMEGGRLMGRLEYLASQITLAVPLVFLFFTNTV